MRVCAAGDIPVVPETALNTPALKQWDGHDNAAGTDVSAISALSDNPKNYYYQWSTMGEDPSRSLKVYQGTEQQVQNQIENYFNDLKAEETGKKTHYNPESTFTQTYAASYNDCNVTFIYGKDGEEYSASSTMKFDSPITTPDNAYFIESVGYLEGWDVDGDGISDIGKDKNNNFVFPNATTDGLVYRGIYEQPDIRVHVQAYDTAQRDYVEVASFSAKSLQQFTFDGKKRYCWNGEKVNSGAATLSTVSRKHWIRPVQMQSSSAGNARHIATMVFRVSMKPNLCRIFRDSVTSARSVRSIGI